MSRKKKRMKYSKKNNKRIKRSRLAIAIFCILLLSFLLVKGMKFTVNGITKIKENITVLAEVVFGPGEDTSDVNREKQFDLEDESGDEKQKYIVYIDAAHGGNDKGYQSKNGIDEKDLNLKISKLVSNRLSSQGDISVVLSRSTDANLTNSQRVEDGNKQNADVFVSIDMTANEDPTAKGVQTFYRDNSNDASDQLATLIQKSVVSYVDLEDREPKALTFSILKNNNMPAIVLQCGYLSNPEEEKKLNDSKFQENLAEGISQGILSFLDAQV